MASNEQMEALNRKMAEKLRAIQTSGGQRLLADDNIATILAAIIDLIEQEIDDRVEDEKICAAYDGLR